MGVTDCRVQGGRECDGLEGQKQKFTVGPPPAYPAITPLTYSVGLSAKLLPRNNEKERADRVHVTVGSRDSVSRLFLFSSEFQRESSQLQNFGTGGVNNSVLVGQEMRA
eukprot:4347176-Prymnesium_polylepis.1